MDFNDDTVKTPNIYALTYSLKEAAPAESAGNSAPAETQLPKTGLAESFSFYLLGATMTCVGAAVLWRKRKEA